jgi:hypothetical protein
MVDVLLILFATLTGVGLVCLIGPLRKQAVDHQRQLVERAFGSQTQKHPGLATAKLVRKKEEIKGESAVSVHTDRIYKCLDGTYLLFLCTSGEPGYVTELSSERAKNALRSTPKILAEEFPDKT